MDDGGVTSEMSVLGEEGANASDLQSNGYQTNAACDLDRLIHALEGHVTGSVSPAILSLALADWLMHLGNAPGIRLDLPIKACELFSETIADTGWLSFSEKVEGRRRDARFAALDTIGAIAPGYPRLALAKSAGVGVASGPLAMTSEEAVALAAQGEPVTLVRSDKMSSA